MAEIRVELAASEERSEVLKFLLRNWPAAARNDRVLSLLAESAAGRLCLDGLITARQGNQICAACWCQRVPGRVANVWPPEFAVPEAEQWAPRLLEKALDFARAGNARFVKALLPVDATPHVAWYRAAGFHYLTERITLSASTDEIEPVAARREPLELVPYSALVPEHFAAVMAGTFVGSHDCPQLTGIRSIDDILADYRATGVFSPDRWLLARLGADDAGCLILTDHPEARCGEILYLGVLPLFRGRGLGVELVGAAKQRVRMAGRASLLLAVDSHNQPALKTYRAAGLEETERQTIWYQVL
ncbi:MAG TPA: GNAT family N-acetyltransferase [Pirellulales bacterium]|nr:GNAT family N-acetyltransferase [Pirellulales bacterium]